MGATHYGATPASWRHLASLGITEDLLPVVANPTAPISPTSKVKEPGKVPSEYNHSRQLRGIKGWSEKRSQPDCIERWMREPDYGVCIVTRRVRAIDVDVAERVKAAPIRQTIERHFGKLPIRYRSNSGKFLAAIWIPGELAKLALAVDGGMVEFLATGQQFIADSTHPSGVRYEWEGGLPSAFPEVTLEQFNAFWSDLVATHGLPKDDKRKRSVVAGARRVNPLIDDPVVRFLDDNGWIRERGGDDGRLHILCPNAAQHTTDTVSSTTYWPAHTGGYARGHFKCMHAHCAEMSDGDFLQKLGYVEEFELDDYKLPPDPTNTKRSERFKFYDDHESMNRPPLKWFVKGVVPRAEVGMIFGPSGCGKSFFLYDLMAAISRGVDWCGHKTNKAKVAWIYAEGAGGATQRKSAWAKEHGGELPGFIDCFDTPDLSVKDDCVALVAAVQAKGGAHIVVIDTLTASSGAADETTKDMKPIINRLRSMSAALSSALMILVHHSGKDVTKGARGPSALKAAMDLEIEIQDGTTKVAEVTKLKDAETGNRYPFRLIPVVTGVDEDGEATTSCVVQYLDPPASRAPLKVRQPVGKNQRIVWATFQDMIGLRPAMPIDELAQAAIPKFDNPAKRDSRRRRVGEAVEKLADQGFLTFEGGVVGLP